MTTFSTIALAVGATASVVGTVGAISAQRKAAKVDRKRQEVASSRERRQAIRQFQIQRAQTSTIAQASGAMGSSSVMGGMSGLGSQLGSGLGFQGQMTALSQQYAGYAQRASTMNALAGIGGGMMSYGFGQGKTFSDVFGAFKKTS
jgi:hypothetical protein